MAKGFKHMSEQIESCYKRVGDVFSAQIKLQVIKIVRDDSERIYYVCVPVDEPKRVVIARGEPVYAVSTERDPNLPEMDIAMLDKISCWLKDNLPGKDE
jgi:trans-2-enoyl-CoA reductase